MMHKVAELEDALLDAAVAKADGTLLESDAYGNLYAKKNIWSKEATGYGPSRWWEQGGPIIEREQIAVAWGPTTGWTASHWRDPIRFIGHIQTDGPSPLIAAMRAYVASKFGEEVELP